MIKTHQYKFNNDGKILFLVPWQQVDIIEMLKLCTSHARIQKRPKPNGWAEEIPTLTMRV